MNIALKGHTTNLKCKLQLYNMDKCSHCAVITTGKGISTQLEAKIMEIKPESSDDSYIIPFDYIIFTYEDTTNIMNIVLKGLTANLKCKLQLMFDNMTANKMLSTTED